ncbi:MAG: hypothetical protein MJ248_06460, partial [Bacilli bacterium]|nr:hypothetical protein [Bacilli bacterium]
MKSLKNSILSVVALICLTTLTNCHENKENNEPSTLVSVVSILDKPMVNANVNVFDDTNNNVLTTKINANFYVIERKGLIRYQTFIFIMVPTNGFEPSTYALR